VIGISELRTSAVTINLSMLQRNAIVLVYYAISSIRLLVTANSVPSSPILDP
jgi:hypothetical protein